MALGCLLLQAKTAKRQGKMLLELTQAMSSIKAITDLTVLMGKVKTDSAIREKAIELQSIILTLQSALTTIHIQYDTLLAEKDSLKQQLMNFENWETEKTKYQLVEVGAGAFVYTISPAQQSTEPKYWLCTQCYENRKKSILQRTEKQWDAYKYQCPICHSFILTFEIPNNPERA